MNNILINLVILNTKIIVYKKRKDGSIVMAIDVLRLLYKEMKADEYDSEVCSKKVVTKRNGKNGKIYYALYLQKRQLK